MLVTVPIVSAAVLGVLVILWAVVLVPMWLKRHDKMNELAAVDRFAGAMRVLSRRGRPTGRYVSMPARSAADRRPHVSAPQAVNARDLHRMRRESRSPHGSSARSAAAYEQAVRGPGPSREERRAQLARRRKTVLAMLVALVLTAGLAIVAGGLFVALQVFVDVIVLGGVLHLRAQIRTERRRRARAEARRAPMDRAEAPRRPATFPEPQAVPVRERRAVFVPADQPMPVVPPGRTASPPPAREVAADVRPPEVALGSRAPQEAPAATAQERPDLAASEAPRPPVAPPVSRPAGRRPHVAAQVARAVRRRPDVVAPRPPRTVDLTQPGKWTDRQAAARPEPPTGPIVMHELMAEQQAEAAAIAADAETTEHELEYLLDRAVGE